jgi:hypothetical protein
MIKRIYRIRLSILSHYYNLLLNIRILLIKRSLQISFKKDIKLLSLINIGRKTILAMRDKINFDSLNADIYSIIYDLPTEIQEEQYTDIVKTLLYPNIAISSLRRVYKNNLRKGVYSLKTDAPKADRRRAYRVLVRYFQLIEKNVVKRIKQELPVRILYSKRVKHIQILFAVYMFEQYFKIYLTAEEAFIISQYTNLAWIYNTFLNTAGIKKRKILSEVDSFKLRTVFNVYINILQLHSDYLKSISEDEMMLDREGKKTFNMPLTGFFGKVDYYIYLSNKNNLFRTYRNLKTKLSIKYEYLNFHICSEIIITLLSVSKKHQLKDFDIDTCLNKIRMHHTIPL